MNYKLLTIAVVILLLLVLKPRDREEDEEREDEIEVFIPEFSVNVEEREPSGKNPFHIEWLEPTDYWTMEYDEENDTVYLGTEEGLFIKELRSGELQVLSYWDGLDNIHVRELHLDLENSRLFVATEALNVIYIVDTLTRSVTTRLSINTTNPLLKKASTWEFLYVPLEDCLYSGLDCGISRLNLSDYSFDFWDYRHMEDYQIYYDNKSYGSDQNRLIVASNYTTMALEYSPESRELFIATLHGYAVFDTRNQSFTTHRVDHIFDKYDFIKDMCWDQESRTLALISDYWLILSQGGKRRVFNLSSELGINLSSRNPGGSGYFPFEWGYLVLERSYTIDVLEPGKLLITGYSKNYSAASSDRRTASFLEFSISQGVVERHHRPAGHFWAKRGIPVDSAMNPAGNYSILAHGKLFSEHVEIALVYSSDTTLPGHREIEESYGFSMLELEEKGWKVYKADHDNSFSLTRNDEMPPLQRFNYETGEIENISLTSNMLWPFGHLDVLFSEDSIVMFRSGGNLLFGDRDFSEVYPLNSSSGLNTKGNLFRGPQSRWSSVAHEGKIYYLSSVPRKSSGATFRSFDLKTFEDRLLINETTLKGLIRIRGDDETLYGSYPVFAMVDQETVMFLNISQGLNESSGENQSMVEFREYNFVSNTTVIHGPFFSPISLSAKFSDVLALSLDQQQQRIYFSVDDPGRTVLYADLKTGNVVTVLLYASANKVVSFGDSGYLICSSKGLLTNDPRLGKLEYIYDEYEYPVFDFKDLQVAKLLLLEEQELFLGVGGDIDSANRGSSLSRGEGLYIFDYGNNATELYSLEHGLPVGSQHFYDSDLGWGVNYNETTGTVEIMTRLFYASIPREGLDQNNTRTQFGEQRIFFQQEREETKENDEKDESKEKGPFNSPSLLTASFLTLITFLWFTESLRYHLLSLSLYTKLKKDDVTSQETRLAIMDEVQRNPGISYNVLMRTLTLGNGTLAYHLQVLEREKLIKSRSKGVYRLFFLKEEEIPASLVVFNTSQVAILNELKQGMRPRTQAELQEALGMTSSTLSYNLRKLVVCARVRERTGEDGKKRYFVPEEDIAL